jgi:hypothetical protein
MSNFIRDSYNGIYKVVLKPYMPALMTVVLLVVGVLVGLFWAYVVSPTVFYDADPSTLEQSWQDEWVKLLADRNAASNFDVSQNIIDLLRRIENPVEVVDRLLVTPGEEANVPRLQAIRPYAEAAMPGVPAPQPSLIGNLLPFIVLPILIVILSVVFSLLWGMLLRGNVYEPAMRRIRGERMSEEERAIRQQVQAAKQAEITSRTDYSTSAMGAPVFQKMSSFLAGHGAYDESFGIDDASGKFLGECGAAIKLTAGTEGTAKPASFELWLFDKVTTMTTSKFLVTPLVLNDAALRARHEPGAELVPAQAGQIVTVEDQSLRMQVRVVDIQFANEPTLPPSSVVQKLTLEFAVWAKQSAGAPAVPAMAVPQGGYVPPPQTAPSAIPAAPVVNPTIPTARSVPLPPLPPADTAAYRPPASPVPAPTRSVAAPPPRPPAPPSEDDPFGGTGDFSPVS